MDHSDISLGVIIVLTVWVARVYIIFMMHLDDCSADRRIGSLLEKPPIMRRRAFLTVNRAVPMLADKENI